MQASFVNGMAKARARTSLSFMAIFSREQ